MTWTPYGRLAPVLDGIDLRVEPGERVLLVGPSGAGKSTLLLALAGVLDSTSHGELAGSVSVDGSAGLLVQDPRDARVAERAGRDVAFGCENAGVPREFITGPGGAVDWAMRAVGFPYGPEHPTSALSGGEAQRLALAGVIAPRPQVLLLDEPTAMLDAASAATVREAVDSVVRETGATLIVVEHRLGPWLPLVDRLVMIDGSGCVAADVPASEVPGIAHELAEHGIWAPGVPDPEPLAVPAELLRLPDADVVQAGSPLVTAHDVGLVRVPPRTFGRRDRTPREALAGVDAQVRAGRVLAIRGDSGAGKSSLVSVLTGLERPTSGQVVVHDRLTGGHTGGDKVGGGTDGGGPADWDSRDLAARIAWVPQESSRTIVGDTVRDSLLATCRALGGRGGNVAGRATDAGVPGEARALALADLLGLTELLDRNPHRLSGGEKRRLALASALAHGPVFVAFDEPTVGQDRDTWAAVAGIIDAVRDGGAGVALSTHDDTLVDAPGLVDETLTLTAGTVGAAAAEPSGLDDSPSVRGSSAARSAKAERAAPLAERAGPLALLAASLVLVPGALGMGDARAGGVTFVLMLLALASVTGRTALDWRRLLPGLIAILSVTWSNWLLAPERSLYALEPAFAAGLRVAYFVVPGIVLVSFIDASALGDHLAQRLKLPPRPVLAAVAAMQRLDTAAADWTALANARRIRGLAPSGRNPVRLATHTLGLTFALVIESIRQAQVLTAAMEARGYARLAERGARRTWAEPAPWTRSDTAMVLVGIVLALLPLVVSWAMRMW
ncbi:MAG: ATP-binding cassette domain-containing protein [Dermatophilus congolensis]|nr:ATP-binding cassette domain-containing protein [Dermatophilus congolensis]